MNSYAFRAIGHIESPYVDKFGIPRQGGLAQAVRVRLKFIKRLQWRELCAGLEGFSHLWLLSVFDRNSGPMTRPKVRPPRLKGKSVGVLASRSPHRPNPLGLTLARLEAITEDGLLLRGVDLMDGTPILDVKPYIHQWDEAPDATDGWVREGELLQLPVEFSAEVSQQIERCQDRRGLWQNALELKALIQETLSQDPRALADQVKGLDRRYWLRLGDYDFAFRVTRVQVIVDASRRALDTSQLALKQKRARARR